jgi:hypothetical protein
MDLARAIAHHSADTRGELPTTRCEQGRMFAFNSLDAGFSHSSLAVESC